MKRLLLLASFLAGGASFALPAKADLIFNLTQDNVGGPAPYAQVDVQRTSQSTATITFDQLGQYYLMDGGSAALNINGGFAIGTITGTAALGATQATYTSGGAGNEDGFGSFNLRVNSNDGWASRSKEIIITLTGGNWASDADVLTGNSQNFLAAAHIGYNGGAITGFAAGNSTPSTVPEPLTLSLLGTGLIGLGIVRTRRHA